jgi:DNA-binding PucR family transcriptional regulator
MHSSRDPYLEKIAALVRHDQSYKRSELLKTLDIFLEHDGSIKDTSESLHVHRNTIIQRLKRIEELCAVDLSQYSTRFVLQSAIMVYQLRTG